MSKPSQSSASALDSAIGLKTSSQRKRLDWTQTRLAQAMQDQGWPWTDQVVIKVEKGQRPVRLAESQALASIFGIEISDLLSKTLSRTISDLIVKGAHAQRDAEAKQGEAADLKLQVARLMKLKQAASGETVDWGPNDPRKETLNAFQTLSWPDTISILLELGATNEDVETLSAAYGDRRKSNAYAEQLIEDVWALLRRLLPTLRPASE